MIRATTTEYVSQVTVTGQSAVSFADNLLIFLSVIFIALIGMFLATCILHQK